MIPFIPEDKIFGVPRGWTECVLCPVYKKGDKLDCKNYLAKILTGIPVPTL
jgi:hypothetical protein